MYYFDVLVATSYYLLTTITRVTMSVSLNLLGQGHALECRFGEILSRSVDF